MTVFDQPFLMLRNPRGGVEDLDQMKQAGFAGIFCNIGDHGPEEWALIRDRARGQGMFYGPWLHTRQADGRFSPARLEWLVHVADQWHSPLIVNSEKEIDGSGDACTGMIAEEVGSRDAAISMEAWLFNPPSVDWQPVAHLPMLLQIFPQESAPAKYPYGCKEHAHQCGVERVYFTFGSYGDAVPAWYDLQAPYSVYTADDIGQGHYAEWQPTSAGFNPYGNGGTTNGGETVTVGIGSAQSAREAFQLLGASSTLDAWRRDNPGEWQKLQAYWIAPAGTGPPAGINSNMGKAHLAVIEARRWAEGSHA